MKVEISTPIFQRLQGKGRALIDTVDDVLVMLLDFHDKYSGQTNDVPGPDDDSSALTVYDADNPPSLRFTEIDSVELAGKALKAKGWNPTFFEVIRQAFSVLGKDVTQHLDAKWVQGKSEKLVYISGADISVQGREANLCWRSILKLARAANLQVSIDFHWPLDEPKSAYPGRKGRVKYDARK